MAVLNKNTLKFQFDITTGSMQIQVDVLCQFWTEVFNDKLKLGGGWVHVTFSFVIHLNGLALYNCFLNFSQHEEADMLQAIV